MSTKKQSSFKKEVEFFNYITSVDQSERLAAAANLAVEHNKDFQMQQKETVKEVQGKKPRFHSPIVQDNPYDKSASTSALASQCSLSHPLPMNGSRLDESWRLAIYYALLDVK